MATLTRKDLDYDDKQYFKPWIKNKVANPLNFDIVPK